MSTTCECSCLQPDPDIAGIGGMVSFAIGSGVTIQLAIAALLLNLSTSKNVVDIWMSKHIFVRLARLDRSLAQRISNNFLLPILFSSSDSQLLTGFIVLLAGWIHFWKNLSVYHFSVIVNMAWSATNSQLLAFFALQLLQGEGTSGNEDAKRYLSKRSKTIRAVVMIGHFGMLFAAVTIQSHRAWHEVYQCPVLCVVKRGLRPGGAQVVWMVVNWCLLGWGYGAAIIPSFRFTSTLTSSISRPFRRRSFDVRSRPWGMMKNVVSLVGAFLESMTFQIIFPCGWFILGLLDMVAVRYYGKIAFDKCVGEDMRGAEDRWGFGQLVPILYLVAPLLPGIDAFNHYKTIRKADAAVRSGTALCGSRMLSTDSEATVMDVCGGCSSDGKSEVDRVQKPSELICMESRTA